MKLPRPKPAFLRGLSLIESVIAIGVIAIVAPLAIAALTSAGGVGVSARAETRAPLMVEAAIAEVRAARQSRSSFLDPIPPGTAFPQEDQALCLAFDHGGRLIGKIDTAAYQNGSSQLNGTDVVYLARIQGTPDPDAPASTDPTQPQIPLFILTTTIEYPAGLPIAKRQTLEFVTKLP